jgi:hypothetical protein
MAKFKYYCSKGYAVATYDNINAEDVSTNENSSLVALPDEDGILKAIIHLAPGERLERIEN